MIVPQYRVGKRGLPAELYHVVNPPPKLAYQLALKFDDYPEAVQKMQDVVLKAGDPEWAFRFAQKVKGADIRSLERVVLKAGDPKWALNLAVHVRGVDVSALERVIIKARDPKWAEAWYYEMRTWLERPLSRDFMRAYPTSFHNYDDRERADREAGILGSVREFKAALSKNAAARSLSDIAVEIKRDWKQVNFAARPYLDAMLELDSINDMYGEDPARQIVGYFLVNASSWRGPVAQQLKAELRKMMGK